MQRLWDLIRRWPLAALACLAALHTAFTLFSRAQWFSDEVRYADAYFGLLQGKWLVLNLNGVAYPDKPPLYFWLLRAIDLATGLHDPAVFFAGAAVSGFLMLWAVLGLAKALRLPDEAGPLAGLLLLSTLFFAGLLHYSRMDLLFAALITAAQASFCLAFTPGRAAERTRRATLALVLAGVATLTKGPLGLAFPVLTTLLYLAWRGRAREFFSRAMLPGLLALVGITCSWVVAAYFMEGPGFLHKIFYEQIFQRATKTFHHAEPWHFYLVAFPPCFLPWTLAVVSLPVGRLLSGAFWRSTWAERKQTHPEGAEGDARAWLWISGLSGLTLLSLLSGKVVVYILPQLAPFALLLALGLLDARLPWRRLWTAAGLLYLVFAAAVTQAWRFLPVPLELSGDRAMAGGLAACGLTLLALRGQDSRRVLTALSLATLLWVLPANFSLAPSLDAIMSPKPQADLLKAYADRGYLPVAHDIYSGIYSYYVRGVVRETASFDVLEGLLAERDVVLAIKKKKWDAWTTRPAGLTIVLEQWLAGQPYYVAVSRRDGAPPPRLAPAD